MTVADINELKEAGIRPRRVDYEQFGYGQAPSLLPWYWPTVPLNELDVFGKKSCFDKAFLEVASY
jgi:hypothetical protein